MSAQHITQDTRFERANERVGYLMHNAEWFHETWGTKVDCDDLCKRMSEAMADDDDMHAIAILRNAIKTVAEREASQTFGVFL